jgi:hypothetical protein
MQPQVTRQTKPSINTFFAAGPSTSKGTPGVEESRGLSSKWTPEIAKSKLEKNEFVRIAAPTGKGAQTKAKASSSAPYKLPMNNLKNILEGTKYTKIEGGRRPKVIFLNYIPMKYIMDKFDELDGRALKRAFDPASVDNFEAYVKSISVTDVPGTEPRSYHLPVRIAGPALEIQVALKVFGLDFARIKAKMEGQNPKKGIFDETNADIIEKFAYHGSATLRVGDTEIDIEENVGDADWQASHIYGEAFAEEVLGRQEASKSHKIVDASGNDMSIEHFHFAALRLNKEREAIVRKNKIFIAVKARDGKVTGWKQVNVEDVKPLKVTTSNLYKNITDAIARSRTQFSETDSGRKPLKSVVLKTEKDDVKLQTAKFVEMEDDQTRYAVFPEFTLFSDSETFDVEKGELLVNVFKVAKKGTKNVIDKDYKPDKAIDQIANALKGMVDEEKLVEIVASLKAQVAKKLAELRKKKEDREEVQANKIDPSHYFDEEPEVTGPETQETESISEPGSA